MDAKITLSFDEKIILKAKRFAFNNNISLSRLAEFLLKKVTNSAYRSLDDIPVSDWVNKLNEGEIEYVRTPRNRKNMRNEFFNKRKRV